MSFSWQLIKMLFYLLLIILLFFIVVKFIKKQSYFQGFNQNLQVLEKIYFNSDQALYLVKVIDEIWVLGISKERMELLSKVTDSDKIEELTDKMKNNDLKRGFKKFFNREGNDND
ncbi:flagellar biosynthetic protein FliO [Sporohalobacter salinus]|uniref:flagellar biosynthetic protein FliO n=1 Tax=Sporohalobacter salinus TaxID=1494606 RepID=UPI001962005F|nr:flagellar biosynthetic protein FliO [Sporohalobacter salinus]MBM7623509.1 flagellar protein FliO/FliZ [Sporohalobacter salinus]